MPLRIDPAVEQWRCSRGCIAALRCDPLLIGVLAKTITRGVGPKK